MNDDSVLLTHFETGWTMLQPVRALVAVEGIDSAEVTATRPLKVYPDGNQWCALWGDDIQSGVAGFGDTPALALNALLSSVKVLAGRR
jgi:hypothetical protein